MAAIYGQVLSTPHPFGVLHYPDGRTAAVAASAIGVRYSSGGTPASDTIPAQTPAHTWDGASSWADAAASTDLSGQRGVLFIEPGAGAELWCIGESGWYALTLAHDVLPVGWVLQHEVRSFQILAGCVATTTVTLASAVGVGKAWLLQDYSIWPSNGTTAAYTLADLGGHVPSGWDDPAFDDSAWGGLVRQTTLGSGYTLDGDGLGTLWGTQIPGTKWIVGAGFVGDFAGFPNWLYRVHFTLPAGTVCSATLQAWADNVVGGGGAFINGHDLSYSLFLAGEPTGSGPAPVSVPPSVFVPGDNVLALAILSPDLGPSSLDYLLRVNVQAS